MKMMVGMASQTVEGGQEDSNTSRWDHQAAVGDRKSAECDEI
jgi:hypothetical protein